MRHPSVNDVIAAHRVGNMSHDGQMLLCEVTERLLHSDS
jgi:hypothetical protein